MGPNFRYCSAEYLDCADHTLALTEMAIAEHLYAPASSPSEWYRASFPTPSAAGFPPSARPSCASISAPGRRGRLLGKQFFVTGRRPHKGG